MVKQKISKKSKKEIKQQFETSESITNFGKRMKSYYNDLDDWEQIEILPNLYLQRIPALSSDEEGFLGLHIIPKTKDGKLMHNKEVYITLDRDWLDQIVTVVSNTLFNQLFDLISNLNVDFKSKNDAIRDTKKKNKSNPDTVIEDEE